MISCLEFALKYSIEGLHVNIIKAMYVKPKDSDLRNGEMLKAFLQDKDTTVTNFIQHSTGSPSQSKSDTVRSKRYPAGSKEVQMFR